MDCLHVQGLFNKHRANMKMVILGRAKSYCGSISCALLPRGHQEKLGPAPTSSWATVFDEWEVPDGSEKQRKQLKPKPPGSPALRQVTRPDVQDDISLGDTHHCSRRRASPQDKTKFVGHAMSQW